MKLKMYFFFPFVRPCMHHNNDLISESHTCKDCGWLTSLDAELYTTCPGERVLVVVRLCNIPAFEALLRKKQYSFLERCRKSNNVWLHALMQSDCLCSSLFFEHYNRILLCDWVLGHCSVCSFEGVSWHNALAIYMASTSLGSGVLFYGLAKIVLRMPLQNILLSKCL